MTPSDPAQGSTSSSGKLMTKTKTKSSSYTHIFLKIVGNYFCWAGLQRLPHVHRCCRSGSLSATSMPYVHIHTCFFNIYIIHGSWPCSPLHWTYMFFHHDISLIFGWGKKECQISTFLVPQKKHPKNPEIFDRYAGAFFDESNHMEICHKRPSKLKCAIYLPKNCSSRSVHTRSSFDIVFEGLDLSHNPKRYT